MIQRDMKTFKSEVDFLFQQFISTQLLNIQAVNNIPFLPALTGTIIRCFHLPFPAISKVEQAELILDSLFAHFFTKVAPDQPLSFSLVLHRFVKDKKEKKAVLIALLYSLYYGEIDLLLHQKQNRVDNFTFFLLQFMATHVNEETLHEIILQLSLDELLRFICYLFKNYREGAFYLFDALDALVANQKIHSKEVSELIGQLLFWLHRNYYDLDYCYALVLKEPEIRKTELRKILENLEAHAKSEIKEFYDLFHSLIPLMINYPIRLWEEFEKIKQEETRFYEPDLKKRTQAERERESLALIFQEYYLHKYTLKQFEEFIRLFGLKGHLPFVHFFGMEYYESSLVQMMRLLHKTFSNTLLLPRIVHTEMSQFFSFMGSIVMHLHALFYAPEKYKKGLDTLSIGIATYGKELSRLPALLSLTHALSDLQQVLNIHSATKIDLREYPIFVFDQSDKTTFSHNQQYIQKLNAQYKTAIVHLSKKDALDIAKRLKLEKLLDTTKKGGFGFGGARNCVFLLTPVLKHAFNSGKKSAAEVLEMSEKELFNLFQTAVLGENSAGKTAGDSIFMLDDDVKMSEVNLFSHALFAYEYRELYCYFSGAIQGRGTQFHLQFFTLEDILRNPVKSFSYVKWVKNPVLQMLLEYMGKAKICLNLPFGSEEAHLQIANRANPALQPSLHLSGTRYPSRQIPSHFFVGLEEHLEKYIPYTLLLEMSYDLVDALNHASACVLPWNDRAFMTSFRNLGDVFAFMAHEKTQKEVQKRFWRNIQELFSHSPRGFFKRDLKYLLNFNLESIVSMFTESEPLDAEERDSLNKIGQIYLFYQQDARYMQEFIASFFALLNKEISALPQAGGGTESWFEACLHYSIDLAEVLEEAKTALEAKHNIKLADFPITEGFYLLVRSLGLGEFCQIIRTIQDKVHSHD